MAEKTPQETISKIREEVKKGKLKTQVAEEMNVSYDTVKKYTRDIKSRACRGISDDVKERIRNEVRNGKSKYQIAKDIGISTDTVYRITKDLPSRSCGWPGIRGETLELLQDLINKGYTFPSPPYTSKKYRILRKYFPSVCKVKMYGKTIFFLEDKADTATRVFLETINKKVISYQELGQITKLFNRPVA